MAEASAAAEWIETAAHGCNGLIRDGATLIHNAAAVIDAVMPLGAVRLAEPLCLCEPVQIFVETGDRERQAIFSLFSHASALVDELIRQAALPSGATQTILRERELGGRLQRHAGAKVSLAS